MKKSTLIVFAALLAACLIAGPAMAKTYKMRLATVVSAPHPWIDAANYMSKTLAEKSKGQIKLTVHSASSLGSDHTTIDEMRMGTIDMVVGGTSPASVFVPEFQLFSLPYLFQNYEKFYKTTDVNSPVFKHIAKAYVDHKLGLKLLALGGGGVRDCSNNLKPIVKPSDMKGMKMRVPGNPIVSKIWSATGALPSPLPWKEIYSAIQTGVVNCFESSISGYYGSRYYEVAPIHSKTQHQFMVTHVSMSAASFKRLPKDLQKLVEEVAAEAGKMITAGGKKADTDKLKLMVEKHGVKVNEVDKKAFITLFAPLQDELAKSANLTELLEKVRAIK